MILRFRLSAAAARDLAAIYAYGIDSFGLSAADAYRQGLDAAFAGLAEHPPKGASVDHIRPGYRRLVYRGLAVYYRLMGDELVVMRIIGRQDAAAALAEDAGEGEDF